MLPARVILAALLLVGTLLLAVAPVRAQRDDALDTPLLGANMCGAGDGSETHFTLAATGDTFPHENIQAVGEAQGYDTLFDYVRPFLQAADLAYTNFDGAMLEGAGYTGYPTFNFNPALATALKNTGIGLVSTANNHILDRGPQGLDATLGVLERAGIQQHGTISSAAAGQARPPYLPLTLTRNGVSIRVAFLSFSWGTNGIPDPFGQVNLLWQSNEYGQQGGIRAEVLAAVAQARSEADLVVVAAHWGYEYQFYPDASQVEGARQLAAAGADLILGAQSHTLQPVDLLDNGGRKTLVIYSLANFLASQGAFQYPHYSATSVIFYVGLARTADGSVRVTGYRYLPTIHVDADTRPAPLDGNAQPAVQAHVRMIMRDPGGARQLSPDPAALSGRVEVCPALGFAATPELQVPGDFAQFYATLGDGVTTRQPAESIAVFGYPTGPVVLEPGGNCGAPTQVLYTERQRLELNPAAAWPYRVVGTQLGAAVYRQRYGSEEPARRTDLAGDAFGDERFRAFFERYGGLNVFGYPISGALNEADASGQPHTVQYFERARMELVPNAPASDDLLAQVQLGLLSQEYAGIAASCDGLAQAEQQTVARGEQPLGADIAPTDNVAFAAATLPASNRYPWFWPTVALLTLALIGVGGWAYGDAQRPHTTRRRARSLAEQRTRRQTIDR